MMTLLNRNPLIEMENLRREINRVLDGVGANHWGNPFARFPSWSGSMAPDYPLLNVSEDGENYYVEALAPGIDPDTLSVTVTRNNLTITGERKFVKDSNLTYHRKERMSGQFTRGLELPQPIDESKVSAEYVNGVIRVQLPKTEEAKPKSITVHVA